jgi:signal transduction histidine kinase/DNA-binding NarL/FixJ family response regulator
VKDRKPDLAPNPNAARVLVVDDDERNLLALSEVLAPIAEVVCSPSGRDALRQLLRDEFAVILLDVFMPDLDGYETAALIREREQTARIPIIFLSAVNKETEHLMRGYAMGAVDYVFKPVDPLVLKSKVSVFVDLFNTRRRLEDSERRQASILQALPMAIYEVVEGGETPRRQFLGGDLGHFLGDEAVAVLRGDRDWIEWVHPEDRERAAQFGGDGDNATAEYRWIGPAGARHHILDQRVATGSSAGTRRWAGSLLDITERKELEARLVHAGKLDALGQLTGGVAHDFNNLLAAMLGGISILQRRLTLGEREQLVMDQMHHAATQGTELVRRMMSFARQQELSPGAVEPVSLCESVAGLVNHTLGGKVTVKWNCKAEGLNLYVDRSQLELALLNLIINARDAMPQGGEIVVEIESTKDFAEGRPMLRLRVADSGDGIPEDLIARVTEPFFTTKETGKGTGLGLSMVSGFAQQSGGEMRIASAVNKGTTIELFLPATEATPSSGTANSSANLDWLADKRLALIDDDDAVRTVLSEQFRDAGGIVDEYASGDEAIAAMEQASETYDFVLSDFAMPGLDGLETLARIGIIAPGARAALMTGNADDARLSKERRVPIIRKPLSIESLAKVFG